MRGSSDVVIQIRGASDSIGSRFPVEAQIGGSGLWRGESVFDFDKLDIGKLPARDYGILLGQQLANPSICRALDFAGVGQGKPVSIRLSILEEPSTARLRQIRWERMYLSTGGDPWPVAISPTVSFSRYLADERPDSDPPADPAFQLLIAIANPSDLDATKLIDVENEISTLLGEFEGIVPTARFRLKVMPGRTTISDKLKSRLHEARWELIEGNTTLGNIRDCLNGKTGQCHALHTICHGDYDRAAEVGKLYLENDNGTLVEVRDFELQSWIHPKLQLMLFQACRTASFKATEVEPRFTGLAARMVRFGVPAVVAMQDYVQMADAREFSAAFYRALLRDGYVDSAVNEGRRAIPQAVARAESTIPALFMRVKDGHLWRADPIREDVLHAMQKTESPALYPLRAVQHSGGLSYDPSVGPDGPLYDLSTRVDDLLSKSQNVCLTGPSGFDKSGQLAIEFQKLADRYLNGEGDDPVPVILSVSDLAGWARIQTGAAPPDLRSALASAANDPGVPILLKDRAFVFLVYLAGKMGELSGSAGRDAIATLRRLLAKFPGSTMMIVCNDALLGTLTVDGESDKLNVLVVCPMDWSDVRAYLMDAGQDALVDQIEKGRLADLAGIPWILDELQKLARRGQFPASRADALRTIASSYVANIDAQRVPRVCADLALDRMAWRVQVDRTRVLDNAAILGILYEVRDRRDFRVSDLRDELVRCGIVTPSGEESLLFQFTALQAYFAARYLKNSPTMMQELEDITATLGRLSRMRHWEDVLLILAGLQQTEEDRVALLRALLAGSSLTEGEQILLAARMCVEMGNKVPNHKVIGQIVDTLIWRSRPDIPRPYALRREATEHLAAIRHPAATRHLISLAVEKFAVPSIGSVGQPKFDHSGIRLIAVRGLLNHYEDTLKHLQETSANRPVELTEAFNGIVTAWTDLLLHDEPSKTIAILQRDDPAMSPIAAFALGQAKRDIGRPLLLDAYFDPAAPGQIRERNMDVMWALTEVLSQQDAAWLESQVVDRCLGGDALPKPHPQLCYLIQKLGIVRPDSRARDYLYTCLRQPEYVAQGRALRALSKLRQRDIEDWVRPLCEQIVQGNWQAVLDSGRIGIKTKLSDFDSWRLQQAALEILRDVGDQNSLEIVRAARLNMSDLVLSELSFQVAEEIYWKDSGGLVRENFSRSAAAGK